MVYQPQNAPEVSSRSRALQVPVVEEQAGQRLDKVLAALLFSALDAGLSERDRLRFMRCYLGGRLPRDRSHWAMWRQVEVQAAQLYRKGQRLGLVY